MSTVVANNLTGCAGSALTIGADNIVLDLAGHTVTGDGVTSGNTEQASWSPAGTG